MYASTYVYGDDLSGNGPFVTSLGKYRGASNIGAYQFGYVSKPVANLIIKYSEVSLESSEGVQVGEGNDGQYYMGTPWHSGISWEIIPESLYLELLKYKFSLDCKREMKKHSKETT